ncbi:Ribosomal_S2 domain-containing protein/UDPGP domain-containing protein [Cephalotus follicularis]|uniref:UTP--glucose-1-phosphate uridylyltransferase n=1 Tax=Cephalotus follicularis TaxID=3775 RepID=A0A1Q3AP73_CEPFO|nr:Ribosomal_S2 domain-containing protein/UDPGP domain-containing protein [Cephalotus follicularis]
MTIHSLVIQKLLSTNAHIGRRVAAHHLKKYTYGIRNATAIFDCDKTLIALRNATHFISLLASQDARFMFINTNPLFDEIVDQMTAKIGTRNPGYWRMGGFLTNNSSPKVFRSRNKKVTFGPTQLPDCVVVIDTERKSSVLVEAERLQVPIVALVDSSMPWESFRKITYPVPANDSVQFVYLFCNIITKCILLEQKKLKAFKGGVFKEDPIAQEKAQEIEQNKSKIDSSIDEVLVVPLESLAPISEDVMETKKLLDKLVVVKLNGALGTDLGFNGPKSAIEVRNGLTFLDITVSQIESLNSKYGCNVPLLLMNTIQTETDTQKVLEKYSKSKIEVHSLSLPTQEESFGGQSSGNRLYPPDSGAMFLSLMKGGTLDELLLQGKEYAFVVDSDNVAAVVDPKILNHLMQNNIEYCMEVTPTTSVDTKDSMVNSCSGKFKLEDIVQNPDKHSVEKFRYLDTRNLWVNLKAIKGLVDTNLLKIENLSTSKDVGNDQILLQETAAGSAIQAFDNAIAVNVPQSRLLRMNATSDLIRLQSSIIGLESLKVTGDVWFGADITLKGRVSIVAKPGMELEIPDVVIENEEISDPAEV